MKKPRHCKTKPSAASTAAPKAKSATPAYVRELGRAAGSQYAGLAVETIDQYGEAVPAEVVATLSAGIPEAIFNTATLLRSKGAEECLVAAFVEGAFAALRGDIARKI